MAFPISTWLIARMGLVFSLVCPRMVVSTFKPDLIDLIKEYTIAGFVALANGDYFAPSKDILIRIAPVPLYALCPYVHS